MDGGIQPGVVPVRVPFRHAFAYSGWAHLKAEDGADDLAIEALPELGSSDAHGSLEAFACGGTELANPLILKYCECRQEDQQGRCDQRGPGRFLKLHRANLTMHKSP